MFDDFAYFDDLGIEETAQSIVAETVDSVPVRVSRVILKVCPQYLPPRCAYIPARVPDRQFFSPLLSQGPPRMAA
jgi:hypothetical protein